MADVKAVVLTGNANEVAEAVRRILGDSSGASAVTVHGNSPLDLGKVGSGGSHPELDQEPTEIDEGLVQRLLAELRRRGFGANEQQRPFLEFLFKHHPRTVTSSEAAKALGISTISLGGSIGGLGLRFQALARERGIRHKPGQVFLKFDRVDREKAYSFTPEGYEAYRRFRNVVK
jgi:hypothetical protein